MEAHHLSVEGLIEFVVLLLWAATEEFEVVGNNEEREAGEVFEVGTEGRIRSQKADQGGSVGVNEEGGEEHMSFEDA